MDKILLKVPIEDGSDECVEVQVDRTDVDTESIELAAVKGRPVGVTAYSLGASMERMLPAIRSIITRLRTDVHAPDEVGLECGLSVGGETGIFFAKGTAEATFRVKLTWLKPGAGEPRHGEATASGAREESSGTP